MYRFSDCNHLNYSKFVNNSEKRKKLLKITAMEQKRKFTQLTVLNLFISIIEIIIIPDNTNSY